MSSVPQSTEAPRAGLALFQQHIRRIRNRPLTKREGEPSAMALQRLLAMTGISQEALEKARSNSAAFTRSAAAQFRESIARQGVDPKEPLRRAAQFTNQIDFPNKGRVIPVDSLGAYSWGSGMPEPESLFLTSASSYHDCQVHAEGAGSGWFTDEVFHGTALGPDDQVSICAADFRFSFVPSQTGLYTLSAGVVFGGAYYLVADDSWYDQKEANCSVSAALDVEQDVSPFKVEVDGVISSRVSAGDQADLFSDGGSNILESDRTGGGRVLSVPVLLFANFPVDVSMYVEAYAYADGQGSIADLNLARDAGGILFCPGLTIDS